MNDFQRRFKNYDNQQLLKIIEDAENYEPAAVEAAKLELSKRDVSQEEIQAASKALQEKRAKVEQTREQMKKAEQKAKSLGAEILETVNPIKKNPQNSDEKINLIAIVFGLIAIFQIVWIFGTPQLIAPSIIDVVPILLLPIAVFLFWKRNKIGWVLMTALFVYNIINSIGILFLSWGWFQTDEYSSQDIQIDFQEIDNLFPQPNPVIHLVIIILFGAALWVIGKVDLRREYQIDVESCLMTIGISALLTAIVMGLI
jgi:DNA-binding transcriptional MerR regulator